MNLSVFSVFEKSTDPETSACLFYSIQGCNTRIRIISTLTGKKNLRFLPKYIVLTRSRRVRE